MIFLTDALVQLGLLFAFWIGNTESKHDCHLDRDF
jgi:hypothetical protein